MYLPFILTSLVGLARAVPSTNSTCCSRNIRSLDDVSSAVECTTVNIYSFTVPAGETFTLNLLDHTTVNVYGDIQFGNMTWDGPLFKVIGNNIKFNGNGYRWDGGGPFYWDGQGLGGGITKPQIMMWIQISGTITNMEVVNSPSHAFGIFNPGPLTVSDIIVDDSQGDYPNSRSNGAAAGRNTDGFNTNGNNITIENCVVFNQDDCIAIKEGSDIILQHNKCYNGHGISIGGIPSDVSVERVSITGNTVINSVQAFRIKTDVDATGGSVSNVVFSGNTASSIKQYGVVVDQSYPKTLGTPGSGVTISNVFFTGVPTNVTTDTKAYMVVVNCGAGSCTGEWDWSSLRTYGGQVGPVKSNSDIIGFSQ